MSAGDGRLGARGHGETRCDWCNVSLPVKQFHQHLNGKRHNSTRFYGAPQHVVRPIEQRNSDGERVRLLKPSEVSDRVIRAVRRVREMATQRRELVAHTGVTCFGRACSRLEPEPICAALLELETKWPPRLRGDGATQVSLPAASALEVLCVADRLRSGTHAPHLELSVAVRVAGAAATGRGDEMDEMMASLALHALVRALGELPRASCLRLQLALGDALRERRYVAMFTSRLRDSLLRSRGALRSLDLSAVADGALRQEDVDGLQAAAAQGWRARELAFLMGTHLRVGALSPIRVLPATVVQLILEIAEAECRPSVTMRWASPAAQPSVPASVPGDDLGFLMSVLTS